LNEIETLRHRCLLVTRILLIFSILSLCAFFVMLLLRGNLGMGIWFGVTSLYSLIGAGVINNGGTTYTTTLKILDAIESLSRQRAEEAPRS
jgi:hypothetical protein